MQSIAPHVQEKDRVATDQPYGAMKPQTVLEKLWSRHVVHEDDDDAALLYIDRHLVYEVTSPQAFEGLRMAGRKPWRAASVLATVDHNVPTTARSAGIADPLARVQVEQLDRNCRDLGLMQFPLTDYRQGIIHVVGPEQCATLPGMAVVASDSHTSTDGAFAALSLGIGTSEVEHVLATQCMSVKRMRPMLVRIEGELPKGVTAKDLVLEMIHRIGTAGGVGYAMEFGGSTVRGMSMEARMTLCNMAIAAGARMDQVAVDETPIRYLRGRPLTPHGEQLDTAEAYWRTLASDHGAHYDKVVDIEAYALLPMVTWGTSPEMVTSIDGTVPDPSDEHDPVRRGGMVRALQYMGLEPGTRIQDIRLDKVFIGPCTNERIEGMALTLHPQSSKARVSD